MSAEMKPKHWYRLGSQTIGIVLIILGLFDGKSNEFEHLDAEWLLLSGVVLVAASARKLPTSIG